MVLLLNYEQTMIKLINCGRRCSRIKKTIIPIVMILSGVIVGIFIPRVIYELTGFSLFGGAQSSIVSVEDAENADITMLAYTVLDYIRDEDYRALSRVVHPEFGVVFSPSATINLTTDRRLNPQQVAALASNTSIYIWGIYNGSGEPIELTPAEYFAMFVPAASHLNSTIIGINRIVRSGNALENILDVFPNVKFVDFHLPGSEQAEEFDWSSLRLGFEEYHNELKLVVIIHSRWTD